MRDPKRIPKVLGVLRALWERHPDMRLGQLLMAAAGKDDIWNIEEDAWMSHLTGWETPHD